jgi:hypothetical protein
MQERGRVPATRLGLTDAEVLGYLFRFPRKRIAAVRLNLFALQGHLIAWVDAHRVAGQRVNPRRSARDTNQKAAKAESRARVTGFTLKHVRADTIGW